MIDRLRRLVGLHVCRSFTQWEVKSHDRRLTGREIGQLAIAFVVSGTVAQRWRERRCLECGRVYMEPSGERS
jgi:hypothetical protein